MTLLLTGFCYRGFHFSSILVHEGRPKDLQDRVPHERSCKNEQDWLFKHLMNLGLGGTVTIRKFWLEMEKKKSMS